MTFNINQILNPIGQGINWFDNTGVGNFFTSTLNSASNFISGIASWPASIENALTSLTSNSTLFYIALIVVGGGLIIYEFEK